MIHAIIDAIGILGLAMLGCGLYLVSPIAMFIVIGVLLLSFALFSESGTISINFPYRKKSG